MKLVLAEKPSVAQSIANITMMSVIKINSLMITPSKAV